MNIFPSYKCNLNCSFCFIKKNKSALLPLEWLRNIIQEVSPKTINILGGEPSILNYSYLEELIELSISATNKAPSLYTNGTNILDLFQKTNLIISYDPCDREKQDKVFSNMLSISVPFSVSMILTENLLNNGIHFLKRVSLINNVKSIDLCNMYDQYGNNLSAYDISDIINISDKITYMSEKEWTFDECLKVLPNKTFLIETRDHKKPKLFTDINQAKQYFRSIG